MTKYVILTGCALFVLAAGCRQSVNPTVPLSPVLPIGSTRVPPPATGSYNAPGYYQGQALSSAAAEHQLADNSAAVPVPSLQSAELSPMRVNAVMPSGYAEVIHPAEAASAAAAPGAYVEANTYAATNEDAAIGSGVLPVGHSAPLRQPNEPDPALRPSFRGMQVVDLTAPTELTPIPPPALNAFSSRLAPSSEAEEEISAAQSPLAPSTTAASVATASATARDRAGDGKVGSRKASSGAEQTATAALPWRRPQR